MCFLCQNDDTADDGDRSLMSPDIDFTAEGPWVLSFWHINQQTEIGERAASIKLCTNGPHRHPAFEEEYISALVLELREVCAADNCTLVIDPLGTAVGHHILAYMVHSMDPDPEVLQQAKRSHLFVIHRVGDDADEILSQHHQITRMEMELAGYTLD